MLEGNQLQCEQLHELMQSADLSSLPDNALVLKHGLAQPQQNNHYIVSVFPDMVQHNAIGATFGQPLPTAGCNNDKACHITGASLVTCMTLMTICCLLQCIAISCLPAVLAESPPIICCSACLHLLMEFEQPGNDISLHAALTMALSGPATGAVLFALNLPMRCF